MRKMLLLALTLLAGIAQPAAAQDDPPKRDEQRRLKRIEWLYRACQAGAVEACQALGLSGPPAFGPDRPPPAKPAAPSEGGLRFTDRPK